MNKYIAKKDTWFKEGTEVKLIDDYRTEKNKNWNFGLFEGMRICENPFSEGKTNEIGEEYLDQEICSFNEFEEIEK